MITYTTTPNGIAASCTVRGYRYDIAPRATEAGARKALRELVMYRLHISTREAHACGDVLRALDGGA